MLKLYDKVLLKDGRTAQIVDIFDDCCIADIDVDGDYDTDFIDIDEIDKIIE
ncbi:MAG: hypothetical protein NC253_02960 [Ruminococcus sp.]|nr:hypothetical protein [Ruminococcus sp.]MCM1380355.1 hypothetical protein [Muribaculaceae bacterium]MCM1478335.1 hypothetical protein [Muribaculaceae bacterium]